MFPPQQPGQHFDPAVFGLTKIAYRVQDAMQLLALSRSAFYALVREKRLPLLKNGRRSIVLAVDLAKLLTEMRGSGGIPSRRRAPKQAPEANSPPT